MPAHAGDEEDGEELAVYQCTLPRTFVQADAARAAQAALAAQLPHALLAHCARFH
jgi:hypothetical protein